MCQINDHNPDGTDVVHLCRTCAVGIVIFDTCVMSQFVDTKLIIWSISHKLIVKFLRVRLLLWINFRAMLPSLYLGVFMEQCYLFKEQLFCLFCVFHFCYFVCYISVKFYISYLLFKPIKAAIPYGGLSINQWFGYYQLKNLK